MNRAATLYVASVCLAALLLLLQAPLGSWSALDTRGLIGAICFMAVGLLSERLAFDFGTGRQARASLSFIPFLASAVLFPPIVTIGIVAAVIATSNVIFRRLDKFKALFNVAQVSLSIGMAALLYDTYTAADARHVNYALFVLSALTFFVTNILLTSGALALLRGESLPSVLTQVVGPKGSNITYDLLASPFAAVTASLYVEYWVSGIFIIVLPLLLMRYSYLSRMQLEETATDLLRVFIKAIETRDPYTSGHSIRVANLAREVARDLGVNPHRVRRIETAALLHDIGKIDAIYSDVIQKPHELNNGEMELIRGHAAKGAELLESLSSVSPEVVLAVRHHHERYDGHGYPGRLSGDAIPLAARIIMVCDSVDAMLSDRPYRRALTIAQTHAELIRCSGSQFDPSIVDVMIQRSTLERAAAVIASEGRDESRAQVREQALAVAG